MSAFASPLVILSMFGGLVALVWSFVEGIRRFTDKWHPESRRVRHARDSAEVARFRLEEVRHSAQSEVIEVKKHQLLDAINKEDDEKAKRVMGELEPPQPKPRY